MRTKLFKQLVLVCFTLLLVGVNQAWAQTTEKNPVPSASNENISGTSYTIDGPTFVASAGSGSGLSLTENVGIKFRANKTVDGKANTIKLAVNEGYKITGIKMEGWTNGSKGAVTITGVYCDDDETNHLTSNVTLPNVSNGASTETFEVTDLNATQGLYITNDATNSQFVAGFIVTYETTGPAKAKAPTITYKKSNPSVVTITSADGADIHYTTDGTDPDLESTKYTAPFEVSTACTVKAIAGNGTTWLASDITTLDVDILSGESIIATWPFDLGTEGQTATIEGTEIFSSDFVDVAQMTYKEAGSDSYNSETIKGTKLQPTVKAEDNGSQYAKFTLKPKKGITFTPTSISFYAQRFGTDGSNKLHYYAESGTTKNELGNVNPNRNGKGTGWSYYEHEISGIEATSENPFALACYVYGLAADKQIGFANVVIKGVYTGEAEEETLYTITTSVSPEGAGTVSQSPAGTTLAEGTAVTFSANSYAGYKFLNKWTVNGEEKEGETYSIEALNSDVNITAQFEALPVLTFAKPEGVVCINRAFPANINTLEKGSTYTLPNNYMYYKEGYTMTGWTDGTSNYNCGDTYTVNGDATLTPTFTENTVSIATRKSAVTVKFDFDQTTNGGRIVNIENNEDIFITTAEVDGQTIDVTLAINCLDNAGINGKRGKVNNTSGNKAQVNPGSVFTIPAANGSVITLTSDATEFNSTTFNDEAGEYNKKIATYTAKENGNVRIVATEDNMSYKSITVTYPVPCTLTTDDADFYTLYLGYDATIPEGIEVYSSVLSEDKTVMTVNKVEGTVLPANTAVLLKSPAGAGEFTFEHATEAAATVETALLGVTEATPYTELTPEGKTLLTLGTKDGVVAFRKPYAADGSLAANRAYLLLDKTTSEAKSIRVVIGGDDTTGISEVNAAKAEAEAPIYNMAGQRVAAGTKGLLIKNGKKYINK